MKVMIKIIVPIVIIFICIGGWIFINQKQPSSPSHQGELSEPKTISVQTATNVESFVENSNKAEEKSTNENRIDPYYEEFANLVEEKIISETDRQFEKFHKEHNPQEYVKMSRSFYTTYSKTKLLYTSDSLPEFYALLENQDYAEYWADIARIIGYISKESKSIEVLCDYIRRSDNWEPLSAYNISKRCSGKIESLKWIGLIGNKEADEILSKALTSDGARELIKEWIDGPLPIWATTQQQDIIGQIQGYAAIGIVYSRNQQNIQLVEKMYDQACAECKEQNFVSSYCRILAEAVTSNQLIESKGMESFCKLMWDDSGAESYNVTKYFESEYAKILNN